MLVISRKSGERLCVGDDVTITILEVAGSTVRIGVDAPAEVPVYRYEIWAAIQAENRAARSGQPGSVKYYITPHDELFQNAHGPDAQLSVNSEIGRGTRVQLVWRDPSTALRIRREQRAAG